MRVLHKIPVTEGMMMQIYFPKWKSETAHEHSKFPCKCFCDRPRKQFYLLSSLFDFGR